MNKSIKTKKKNKLNIHKNSTKIEYGGLNFSHDYFKQSSGDCWFLINNNSDEKQLIIFDCGSNKNNLSKVGDLFSKKFNNFKEGKVSIIISHNDSDHTKGIIGLLKFIFKKNKDILIDVVVPYEFINIKYLYDNYYNEIRRGIIKIVNKNIKDIYNEKKKEEINIEEFKRSFYSKSLDAEGNKSENHQENYSLNNYFKLKKTKEDQYYRFYGYFHELDEATYTLSKIIEEDLKIKTGNIEEIIEFCLCNSDNVNIVPIKVHSNKLPENPYKLTLNKDLNISIPNAVEINDAPILPKTAKLEEFAELFIEQVKISIENNHCSVLQIQYCKNIIAFFSADSLLNFYRDSDLLNCKNMKLFVYPHHGSEHNIDSFQKLDGNPEEIIFSYHYNVKLYDFKNNPIKNDNFEFKNLTSLKDFKNYIFIKSI